MRYVPCGNSSGSLKAINHFNGQHFVARVSSIPIIDLFAGPGGLGEGFASYSTAEHENPFQVRLSVEKDPHAHRTLTLRSFFRNCGTEVPDAYYQLLEEAAPWEKFRSCFQTDKRYYRQWEQAEQEAFCCELGPKSQRTVDKKIRQALGRQKKHWVLIGGPPCQAYSLAGRVRNKGIANYRIEDDRRSRLYEEYLQIIAKHRPAVFVMENVKGMLSATVEKRRIFEKIIEDLQTPPDAEQPLHYRIVSVAAPEEDSPKGDEDPRRFIIHSERYGVPQQRHRVILIGIRSDLKKSDFPTLTPEPAPTVKDMLESLPRLRSGLSRGKNARLKNFLPFDDAADVWKKTIQTQLGLGSRKQTAEWIKELERPVRETIRQAAVFGDNLERGGEFVRARVTLNIDSPLKEFIVDDKLKGVLNHSTRSHMYTDLARYMYCAAYAAINQRSPRLNDFPEQLLPDHLNALSGHFNDRFRVQLADSPATTITSHIAKDGHYFIHYDPTQCRSLTVREAARLQTFPDNYYFCGPRTEQYTQVGNAVPPWLARQIAHCVWEFLK